MSARYPLCFCLLMMALQPVCAAGCRARFGEIVDMTACETVALPDFDVQFTGTSQPNPGLPLLCWNYRITATKTKASADVSQCHTGELGGNRDFLLDGKAYTFLFDLSKGCARSQRGQVTPAYRGHAFMPGAHDSKAARALRDKEQKAESACNQQARPAT